MYPRALRHILAQPIKCTSHACIRHGNERNMEAVQLRGLHWMARPEQASGILSTRSQDAANGDS